LSLFIVVLITAGISVDCVVRVEIHSGIEPRASLIRNRRGDLGRAPWTLDTHRNHASRVTSDVTVSRRTFWAPFFVLLIVYLNGVGFFLELLWM